MAETVGFLVLDGLEAAGVLGGTAAAVGGTTIFAGLTVAAAVGTAAIIGVSAAVAYATAPEVPKPSSEGGTAPLRQSIPPRPFGYGRSRLAGAYVLFEAPLPAEDNDLSYDVLALHQGRVSAIQLYYLGDDLVSIDGSGVVNGLLSGSDQRRYGADGLSSEGDLVTIRSRLGLATETAYSEVIAVLPTLWTSDHRGDGVASLMLRCRAPVEVSFFTQGFPRGLPKPSVVADLSPIWDPRDLGQDRNDPDTWAVTSNPVLQLLDYLTHEDRGPALDYDLIEPRLAEWMAEADICDDPVDKADGSTEPRYKSNGWAFLSTDPAEVIAAILATCDGWLTEGGDGTLALKVGLFRDPRSTSDGVVLTDDHIVGFTIDKGVGDEEIVNEVQFIYTAQQANWREVPGLAFRDDASIAALGLVRSERLELTWVQSHSQGRRLAKRKLARNQATARGQIVTTLYGLKALGHRWVGVRSRLVADLVNSVIEVNKVRIDLANARVVIDWTMVNPNEIDAWDPGDEEGDPPTYFSVPENVSAADAGAGNQINVEFDALDPTQPWLYYVVEYRVGTSGQWTRQLFAPTFGDPITPAYTDIGGGRFRLQTSAVGAGTYSVRVAATGHQVVPDGVTVVDPDLVWAPDIDGVTGVVIA
jgi:hypothetical protein